MTAKDMKKLDAIVGKIENLQNSTDDTILKDRLQVAKSELLRAMRD